MARRKFPSTNMDRNTRPWTRFIEGIVEEYDRRNEREDSSGLNANKAQAAAAKRQALTIRSLPFNVNGYDSRTGFGLSAGWNVVAEVTIKHPVGWETASFTVIGGAAALDDLTGGVTLCQARIVIGGTVSTIFAPAKDAGASKVNNVLTANFTKDGVNALTSTETSCTLELQPVNPSAFPAKISNYSSLTVLGVFTNTVFPTNEIEI